jgi:8-oxo-dGTP diphosphatase
MTETHLVAKVLLVNSAGEVLTLRRSNTDQRRPGEDDIPGGWVDEGEELSEAAVRETEEEAGIKLNKSDIRLVYAYTAMTDKGNVVWAFYIGRTEQTEVTLSSEHDRAEWVSLDSAIESFNYKLHKDFLVYVRDNSLL